MTRNLLATALLALSFGTGAVFAADTAAPMSYQTAPASDPAAQIYRWADLFRANDVAGLAQALMPPSKWELIRAEYARKQLEPISDEDRAEFAEMLQKVTAADAVDRLMAEIEPKLDELRPQVPGAMLMAFGAMQMAANSPDSELTEEQRQALQQAIPGIQAWASGTDFVDPGTLRDALTLLSVAARQTGIDNLDQLKNLPLEAALDRARPMLTAAKQAAQLYGIDPDAIVDSLQVELVALEGDTARVRITVTPFDTPLSVEHDMVLIEGRWFGKHSVEHWQHHEHDDQDDLSMIEG